ncbi:hypothetical protein ACVWY2_006477 [Bradyrhizobium sp. JR6.1]
MACHRKEARLGAVGGVGLIAGFGQRALAFGAVGDVPADALHLGRRAGIVAHEALAPGDPARPERSLDLLVVDPRAVGFERGVALLEHLEGSGTADQFAAGDLGQRAIGVVGVGDEAVGVAQHDQIVLRLEQGGGALFGLLQFPVAVGHRLIVHDDGAQPSAHQPQPDAERYDPETGQREQEADADRECIGIVAAVLREGAGNEPEGAAECDGEDREGTDDRRDPGMASQEAAKAQLDPEETPHQWWS